MDRLMALNSYWREYPPIHILVKGFTGYKSDDEDRISLDELRMMFPDGMKVGV